MARPAIKHTCPTGHFFRVVAASRSLHNRNTTKCLAATARCRAGASRTGGNGRRDVLNLVKHFGIALRSRRLQGRLGPCYRGFGVRGNVGPGSMLHSGAIQRQQRSVTPRHRCPHRPAERWSQDLRYRGKSHAWSAARQLGLCRADSSNALGNVPCSCLQHRSAVRWAGPDDSVLAHSPQDPRG